MNNWLRICDHQLDKRVLQGYKLFLLRAVFINCKLLILKLICQRNPTVDVYHFFHVFIKRAVYEALQYNSFLHVCWGQYRNIR